MQLTKGVATAPWQYFTPFCIELMEVRIKPENFGWVLLIEYIQSKSRYQRFEKVGIIVDSDLGNLKSYNSRDKAIFESFYLPEKYQLIYASSDAGKDLFANQMLKYADKVSTQCLKALMEGVIPLIRKGLKASITQVSDIYFQITGELFNLRVYRTARTMPPVT